MGDIIYNVAHDTANGGYSGTSEHAGIRFVYNAASYGDSSKQGAIIEGAAHLAAVTGTNASIYRVNHASLNTQHGRYQLYDVALGGGGDMSLLKTSDMNVVTRHEDGTIKAEYKGVMQVAAQDSATFTDASAYDAHNKAYNDKILALWFMPFYAHEAISGMDAGSYSSDFTMDLYGMAMGADKTFTQIDFADALRLGLSFNVGCGETETSGDFDYASNEFDFYGISAYAAAQFGKFTLSADIAYGKNEGEVHQDLSSYGMESLKADVESDIWSFGLRGEYAHILENKSKVVPYVGLELISIKTDDYDVEAHSALGGTIFSVESERQNVINVPFGVRLNKDFALKAGLEDGVKPPVAVPAEMRVFVYQ